MDIIETFVRGKRADQRTCEDVVVVTPHFTAVLDGATDIAGDTYDGMSGGRFAAHAVAAAVHTMPADATARDGVVHLSGELRTALRNADRQGAGGRPPACTALVYSRQRAQVWRVGDGHIRIGSDVHRGHKAIDEVTSAWRRAWTHALLAGGATLETLRQSDPGFAAMWPLVQLQGVFANDPSSPYGYGVLDGSPVPDTYVEIFAVPSGSEVVLATDGYPVVCSTLAQSEQRLSDALNADPLSLGPITANRGTKPEWESFDDRAYVRLRP